MACSILDEVSTKASSFVDLGAFRVLLQPEFDEYHVDLRIFCFTEDGIQHFLLHSGWNAALLASQWMECSHTTLTVCGFQISCPMSICAS